MLHEGSELGPNHVCSGNDGTSCGGGVWTKCKMSPKQLESANEASRAAASISASGLARVELEEIMWN